jgi:hypothetical protein
MPGKSQSGGVDIAGVVYLGVVLLLMFLPMILGWRRNSPPGGPDSDSEDGWGRGPSEPRLPPDAPRGGIPLRDAEPARVRLRGHDRLMDRAPARDRRSAPEPARKPVRS